MRIKIENGWAEDILDLFENRVTSHGGDGHGEFACNNYQEVAEWFLERHPLIKEHFQKDIHPDCVHIHDNSNENFIFTNKDNKNSSIYVEEQFIVTEDIKCGFSIADKRIIQGIKLEK